MEPLLSALQLQPPEHWQADTDPLGKLAATVSTWSAMGDFARHADTVLGRLTERYDELSPTELIERQLDYGLHGTLWTEHYRGRLLHVAELWSAAEMLVDDSLDRCTLACLCACESGRGELAFELDELTSLPSSLEMSFVDTVICTLWPVPDVAGLVFAVLFYEELAAARALFDVRGAVRRCRARLATMELVDVLDGFRNLQTETTNAVVKARLEWATLEIRRMADVPFAHPIHWGAFVCYGAERLALPG